MEGMGQAMGTGSITLKHREFIGNVTASGTAGAYKVEHYGLNAGDETTFPQLSYLSKLFEKFRINACAFEYIPMTGFGGDTNALGVVTLSTQVDPRGQLPTNKKFQHDMSWTSSGIPARHNRHVVEAHPDFKNHEFFYCRDENVDRPIEFVNPATVSISSEGVPTANQVLGELWVTYNVTLTNLHSVVEAEALVEEATLSRVSWTSTMGTTLNMSQFSNLLVPDNVLNGTVHSDISKSGGCIIKSVFKDGTHTTNGESKFFVNFDRKDVKQGEKYRIDVQFGSDDDIILKNIQLCGSGGFGYAVIKPAAKQDWFNAGTTACETSISNYESNGWNGQVYGYTAFEITKQNADPNDVSISVKVQHPSTVGMINPAQVFAIIRVMKMPQNLLTNW